MEQKIETRLESRERKDTYKYKINGNPVAIIFIDGIFFSCEYNFGNSKFYGRAEWKILSKIARLILQLEKDYQLSGERSR